MKWAALPLCLLGMASAALVTEPHTVYLLPMVHGLDQFIANRLTRMQVLQVVTDPAKADCVFTDRVGEGLESRLDELYPKPAAHKEAEAKAEESKKEGTKAAPPILGDTANKLEKAGSLAVFGQGRGTIFLVDVRSRQVLWSIFEKPRDFSPHGLDRTADRIVKRLKTDLAPPKPEKPETK
jgi:hypothetical protein